MHRNVVPSIVTGTGTTSPSASTSAPQHSHSPPAIMATNAPYPATPSWVDMSHSYPSNSLSDYGAYPYVASTHGLPLPSESLGRHHMPPPPLLPPLATSHSSAHPHHSAPPPHHGQHQSPLLPPPTMESPHAQHPQHPPLPHVIVPSHPSWPSSMVGNPMQQQQQQHTAGYSPAQAPPQSQQQQTVLVPKQVKSQRTLSNSSNNQRRMLTDNDRRRMCLYHEEFPWKKQTEIGEIFGVERSTVSKVLRKKEKFLGPEEINRNPTASQPQSRVRVKMPDLERALLAWMRKAQAKGIDLDDAKIIEQARLFSRGMRPGPHGKDSTKFSPAWLDRFKQKHSLGPAAAASKKKPLGRRSSDSVMAPSSSASSSASSSHAGPVPEAQRMSISHLADPATTMSPVSPPRDEPTPTPHGPYAPSGYYDVPDYKSGPAHTAGPLLSASFSSEPSAPAFSQSAITPDGNFTFSPDSNVGSFMHQHPHSDPRYQRPRSQTFPIMGLEFAGDQDVNSATVAAVAAAAGMSDVHHSPDGRDMASYPIDPVTGHMVRRMDSAASLHSHSHSRHGGSPGAAPRPPTALEEAQRGLDVALNYVSKCGVDNNDFMMVVRFFETVGLRSPAMGMARIPEAGDMSMPEPIKTE